MISSTRTIISSRDVYLLVLCAASVDRTDGIVYRQCRQDGPSEDSSGDDSAVNELTGKQHAERHQGAQGEQQEEKDSNVDLGLTINLTSAFALFHTSTKTNRLTAAQAQAHDDGHDDVQQEAQAHDGRGARGARLRVALGHRRGPRRHRSITKDAEPGQDLRAHLSRPVRRAALATLPVRVVRLQELDVEALEVAAGLRDRFICPSATLQPQRRALQAFQAGDVWKRLSPLHCAGGDPEGKCRHNPSRPQRQSSTGIPSRPWQAGASHRHRVFRCPSPSSRGAPARAQRPVLALMAILLRRRRASSFAWAFKVKGVDYEFVNVEFDGDLIQSDEFKAWNPNALVPVIRDGDFSLFEGNAILTYASAKFGWKDLYPTDVKTRAKVDQFLNWHHTNTRLFTLQIVRPAINKARGKVSPSDFAVLGKADALIEKEMTLLETFLDKDYIAHTDAPTVADYAAYCEIDQLEMMGYDFAKYPKVTAWIERMKVRTVHALTVLHRLADLVLMSSTANPLPRRSARRAGRVPDRQRHSLQRGEELKTLGQDSSDRRQTATRVLHMNEPPPRELIVQLRTSCLEAAAQLYHLTLLLRSAETRRSEVIATHSSPRRRDSTGASPTLSGALCKPHHQVRDQAQRSTAGGMSSPRTREDLFTSTSTSSFFNPPPKQHKSSKLLLHHHDPEALRQPHQPAVARRRLGAQGQGRGPRARAVQPGQRLLQVGRVQGHQPQPARARHQGRRLRAHRGHGHPAVPGRQVRLDRPQGPVPQGPQGARQGERVPALAPHQHAPLHAQHRAPGDLQEAQRRHAQGPRGARGQGRAGREGVLVARDLPGQRLHRAHRLPHHRRLRGLHGDRPARAHGLRLL
ncbi:hypothetical protein ON010_g4679 [Phytophthora cinnamomi]|nr:hypothetical protein ON010_g4679 [Phytophthora cinnamomi]